MGSSNEDIIKSIKSYQERLERYALNKNEEKMLYMVKKLSKLPINTAHLENTGVGRTVNALKKHEGKVGDAAKELVALWKDMVLREEKANQEDIGSEREEEDVDSVYSSDHEINNFIIEENDSPRNNQSNSSPVNDYYNDYDEEIVNSKEYKNKNVKKISSETEQEVEKYSSSIPEDQKKSCKKRERSVDCDDVEKRKSKKSKRDHESRSKRTNDKYDDRPDKYDSRKKEKDSEIRDRSSKSKSEKRKKEDTDIVAGKSQQHLDKKESHTSKSHSRLEKHEKHKEKDESGTKSNSTKTEKKHKSHHHHEKDNVSKKVNNHENHYSDFKNPERQEKNKKHKKTNETKSVNKDKIINGIDSESGASFAEALGMCGPKTIPSTKKKPSTSTSSDKHRNGLNLSSETSTSAGSSSSYKPSNSKSVPVSQEAVPDLLIEKELEPLNINISSLLPEISPNYRPLGVNLDSQPKRVMTDDEALSRVMSNRNQRTKVYSGNKSFGKVESLFQICVRILQDNIDALEYTGGVPYSILKPILERATPDQLFNMEHHNPYLIEDTDELWLLHCQKEFRTKKREELESWRDMYMRCLDEREARLNAITANIKQSQDKSIPIRTTKLAYVDSVVKPPRNVARQQAKNGIIFDKKHISTTTKLSALAKSGEAGKISVPNPGSRAGERSSNAAALKPKKAPLMAKTLSFLKNRFKR